MHRWALGVMVPMQGRVKGVTAADEPLAFDRLSD